LRKPTFFIIGAPKCGTTSLAAWLRAHRDVFMSPMKEPDFFNTDDRQGVTSLSAYENLFCEARNNHIAVGEASVWYLSSSHAVRNILDYQPEARFIVMVRNPVEMSAAVHAEMVFWGHETVRDFQTAWDLQAERRQGRQLPRLTWARRRLLYGEICLLGAQLERLLTAVPASRVLVVVLDDLAVAPRQQYLRVLQFLGVDDDGRVEFPTHNKAKILRWPRLTRAMFVAEQIKHRMGIKSGLGLWSLLLAINKIETPRPALSFGTAAILREYFTRDVELLGRILRRDLKYWLEPHGRES
jgi:hypothetical protein